MTFARPQDNGGDTASAHARAWIVRLHSGEVAQRDLQALEKWRAASARHEQVWQAELSLWRALGPALEAQASAVPAKPVALAAPPQASSSQASRRAFLGGALATSIAAAAGIGLLARPDEAGARVVETAKGETRRVTLAHGLDVTLNTDSRLVYWPGADAPRLKLDRGEAIIGVAMAGAASLRVEAERCAVTAREARFLLREDGERTRVACLSGSIAVRSDGRDIVLGARRSLVLGENLAVPVEAAAVETEGAWQRGLFVFKNRPAGEVVAELNRYRPGYVYLPQSRSAVRISGVLKVDRADQAVDHIARILAMEVTRMPGGIAILR